MPTVATASGGVHRARVATHRREPTADAHRARAVRRRRGRDRRAVAARRLVRQGSASCRPATSSSRTTSTTPRWCGRRRDVARPLAPGVYAWLADEPGHGRANAGVVVDEDGITLIDTLAVASQWDPFAAEVEALGFPIRRIVLTSSNAEFSGGTARFRLSAVYARPQASEHLDQPADPEVLRRLYPRSPRRSTTSTRRDRSAT